jgi:hypothetical protein
MFDRACFFQLFRISGYSKYFRCCHHYWLGRVNAACQFNIVVGHARRSWCTAHGRQPEEYTQPEESLHNCAHAVCNGVLRQPDFMWWWKVQRGTGTRLPGTDSTWDFRADRNSDIWQPQPVSTNYTASTLEALLRRCSEPARAFPRPAVLPGASREARLPKLPLSCCSNAG